MDWIEVTLRTNAALTEAAADILRGYGYQGVALERGDIPDDDPWDEATIPPPTHHIVRAYLPTDGHTPTLQAQIEVAFASMPIEQPVFRKVAEEDWAEAWKANYHPVRLGRLLVRPAWESADLQPDDVEIVLDPGMAFGTGTHATTQLCLQALDARPPTGGEHVLDLGCGSAILAIAAAKLGAASVYAIDIDAVAVQAARENVTRNGVAGVVTVAAGGLPDVLRLETAFDYALVNILARVILQMTESGLERIVRPGGRVVFSGLIASQQDEVEAALHKIGLIPRERSVMDDWVLIEAVRVSATP